MILRIRLEDDWNGAGARDVRTCPMEIRVLGPLEVGLDGRPVELPSAKACLLLASLVVRANEVVSTDRLFEVLWGAQPPDTAANTLQTYVAHLRAVLEPERARREAGRLLVTRPPGYVLAIEPDQIDAVRFRTPRRAGPRRVGHVAR